MDLAQHTVIESLDQGLCMLFPGLHIPLITVEQFEHSQRVRGMRSYSPSNASRARRFYPLSGVLRCQRCGETFRGNAGNGDVRYYEDSGVAKGVANCPRRMFRADAIERAIFARVEQLQIPETWDADILPFLQTGPVWNQFRRERRAAQSRLNAAREMLQQEIISIGEFKEAERQCESHIAHLEQQIHIDDDYHQAFLRDFPRLWKAATETERRGLLRSIFSVIWLRDGEIVGYETRTPFKDLLPDESNVVID